MKMRRANLNRHAKVIATLGPASSKVETISNLILAGMNVARINMGHGTEESRKELIENVRKASQSVGLEVAVLIDLQGPKIRVGRLESSLELKKDETWVIGISGVKNKYPEYESCFIPTIYENLVDDCQESVRILFDDGLITAEAVERDRDVYKIKIIEGGTLKSNKGINLPDTNVSAPSLTERDRKDIIFGIENNVDLIALSFARKKEDVLNIKDIIRKHKKKIPVVAKIENQEGVDNIDEILEATDALMVARGDLGVELGNHLVPSIQKQIIIACNNSGVPVITATQMMESMIENPVPTRAEASDVANAVWDGTDAVMLSAETAAGKFPVEAIKMMGEIITAAEKTPKDRPSLKSFDLSKVDSATMVGASLIAENIGARRIVSVTQSGSSCLKLSWFRPQTSILGVSNSISIVRKMCLLWGVSPFYLDDYDKDDTELEGVIINRVRDACQLEKGDKIVITRGSGNFFVRGTSNSIKVIEID